MRHVEAVARARANAADEQAVTGSFLGGRDAADTTQLNAPTTTTTNSPATSGTLLDPIDSTDAGDNFLGSVGSSGSNMMGSTNLFGDMPIMG